MNTAIAKQLGYDVRHNMTQYGKRWFVTPCHTHFATNYGSPHRDLAGALADVESRVAYKLKCDVPTLREHLAKIVSL